MRSSFSDKGVKLIAILCVLVPWWLPERVPSVYTPALSTGFHYQRAALLSIIGYSLLVIRITSNPGEIRPPCGIPPGPDRMSGNAFALVGYSEPVSMQHTCRGHQGGPQGFRLMAEIPQGKHFTGQAINK